LPLVAPAGTVTVIEPAFQLLGAAAEPLKVTAPGFAPKPVPEIVTVVPKVPEPGETLRMFGATVKFTPLLETPFAVTITLPVEALAGTAATIEPAVQLEGVAAVPLNVTDPAVGPNPVPLIVTVEPMTPTFGDNASTFGTTVNADPLLATPFTVTTTVPAPELAAVGTGAVMDVALQLVGVDGVPLKLTVLLPCRLPKPEPVIVTGVPAIPDGTDKLPILGTTVKATPLLGPLLTVTTTLPLVAAAGTATAIEVDFQLVGVAGVPLNVTVLLPCDPAKLAPVMVTAVPTGPDVIESPVMDGNAVPVPVRFTVCGLFAALSVMVSVPG